MAINEHATTYQLCETDCEDAPDTYFVEEQAPIIRDISEYNPKGRLRLCKQFYIFGHESCG